MARQLVMVAENIGVEPSAITDGPHLHASHVDGPVITWAGHMHWLTLAERLSMRFGSATVLSIAEHRWPHLAKLRRELEA